MPKKFKTHNPDTAEDQHRYMEIGVDPVQLDYLATPNAYYLNDELLTDEQLDAEAAKEDQNRDAFTAGSQLQLQEAIEQLTEKQQAVVKLHLEGLTQEQIATKLGVNQSTVTKSLYGNINYTTGKKYGGILPKLKKTIERAQNGKRSRSNTGIQGIRKAGKSYQVRRDDIYLGSYRDIADAARAYRENRKIPKAEQTSAYPPLIIPKPVPTHVITRGDQIHYIYDLPLFIKINGLNKNSVYHILMEPRPYKGWHYRRFTQADQAKLHERQKQRSQASQTNE